MAPLNEQQTKTRGVTETMFVARQLGTAANMPSQKPAAGAESEREENDETDDRRTKTPVVW